MREALPACAWNLLHSSCWLSMHGNEAGVLEWSSVLLVSRQHGCCDPLLCAGSIALYADLVLST